MMQVQPQAQTVTDVETRETTTKARSRRRVVLRVVVVAALVLFVVVNRAELPVAWHALRTASIGWLAGALVASLLWLVNFAALQDRTQRLLGVHRPFRRTLRLTAGGHFLNMITKSGGMAGVAPFNADARATGQSAHRSTAGYLVSELVNHLGFTLTLLVAVPVIVRDGRLSVADVIAIVVFAVLTATFLAGVIAASRSKESIRALHALPNQVANWVRRRTGRAVRPVSTDHHGADDLHEAVVVARRHRRGMVPVAVHAIAHQLIGFALLWTVLHSMGVANGTALALVTYAIGTLFSIVGVLPGGLGFTELSMTATLVSYGVSAGQAAAVVGVYRLFQLWIPLALGAMAMHSWGSIPALVSGPPSS